MAKNNMKLVSHKNAIKDEIFARINQTALGNSKRGLKELASDLVNQIGKDHMNNIVAGTFLCPSTIDRVMECDPAYRPQAETLERIFRYCGMEAEFREVIIKKKFLNQPKED